MSCAPSWYPCRSNCAGAAFGPVSVMEKPIRIGALLAALLLAPAVSPAPSVTTRTTNTEMIAGQAILCRSVERVDVDMVIALYLLLPAGKICATVSLVSH